MTAETALQENIFCFYPVFYSSVCYDKDTLQNRVCASQKQTLYQNGNGGKFMEKEKLKILVADDETEIRDVLSMLLTAEGFEVITAADGKEALALADESVDLYILDVNMPLMSGFAA